MRIAFALVVFAPAIAVAQPVSVTQTYDPPPDQTGRFEIGVALGGHAFSKSSELGSTDDMADPGPSDGAAIGLRLAYPFTNRLALEGEALVIPTKDDVLGMGATVYGLRAHLRVDFLTGKLRPFAVAGGGVHVLRSSSPQLENDIDQAWHVGLGVRYAMTDHIDVRFDARDLIVPDRTHNGATDDYEITAGLTYRFGGDKPIVRIAPPPPPVVGDRDGDGIPDNLDKCPDEPEDKDGFQDADGCPDPDNDNDGIPDTMDKCPNDPETKNGFQDADGCPDEVIRELAGIGFELDSAKIDAASAPILEAAFKILSEYPQLSVEISGHTSSEGLAARNLDLSLRRAEAVKAWLIKRGIAEPRLLTVGHGSDKPIADNATEDGRRKNRRIEFRILLPADVN
jgi:outer membrane protein OmpA-like peptidoglycan-associated protein/opacity protein-like surface antigen